MAKKDITRRQHGETFTRVTAETHDFQLQPFQGLVLEVEDTHFHHDSAVLLPNFPAEPGEVFGGPSLGLSVIAECLLQQNAHPDATVLITGHADTSGPDQYNIGISIKRAKAVQHAIMGEREPWISIAEGQHKTEDYQLILTWVAMVYGWDCNPQGVDNVNGDNTKKAVKNFQERYNQEFDANIATDGKAGHDTWGAFFDVYMDMVQNLCETDEAGIKDLRAKMNFIGPKIVGCGENWPVEEPQRPNYRSQINRRVEILFFKSGQEPLLDCHPGGNVCKPVFCEIYNLKMYRFDYLPVKPSLPRPTQVFLKLQYLDPEGNEKLFPKDFPVTILYPDNTTQDEKVGDDGILRFGAQRKTSFTLKFESSETLWVAVSADDAASKLARKTDLAKLHKDKFRFFSTPKTWTLVESKWAVAANAFYKDDPEYKFYIPGRYGRTIGNGLTPVDMKLDPHWSFLRFEFFDRNYGHSDHNNKRVNIPATLISGWRNSPASGDPDATSHWTLNDADTEKAVHAIPWIIQKKPDNSDDPRPDKNIQFGLKTDWLHVSETAYVIAKSATERVVETRPNDHDDIKPAAKRLEFYDLPKEWISKKYYCRFTDNTGKFFDQAATFEDKIKASLKAPAQFLAFSLDDIVLTTAACAPVTLHAQDRVAVYFHRFEKTGDFPTTDAGLYNPDTGPNQSYYSLPQLNGTNYIFDYPNWTRLVIAQGNMFDVFSERVTSGDLIGARAGVMWVDAVAASPGAPDTTVADPPDQTINASRTDKKYFSIHPCFTQYYAAFPAKYTGPSMGAGHTGRQDMALIRCCDRDGDTEKCVNLHYFRLFFWFSVSPSGGVSQAQYMERICQNVAARWNGNDTVNGTRTELIPKDAANKIQGSVVFAMQPAADPAGNRPWTRAHYRVKIVSANPPPNLPKPRNFMNSVKGFGEFGDTGWQPENGYATGSYTAAHETGHGDGLPDEYCERWNSCSYGELSFWYRTPGDVYDPDGRADPSPPNRASVQVETGMMTGVVKMRNRYFWHCAEFLRAVTKAAGQGGPSGVRFKVKYDTFDDYWVPPHDNSPDRSYVYWPIKEAIDVENGSRGKFDLLLYTTGKDKYTCNVMTHSSAAVPFDGILVFYLLLNFKFNSWPGAPPDPADSWPAHLLPMLRGVVGATFNNKFAATGKINAGTDKEWEFKRCLVRFAPRVRVAQPADPKDALFSMHQGWLSGINSHFDIDVDNASLFSTPSWGVFARHRLTMNVKTSDPAWSTKLVSQFVNNFAEMIGMNDVPAVNKLNLRPLIQRVITGGNVIDLP